MPTGRSGFCMTLAAAGFLAGCQFEIFGTSFSDTGDGDVSVGVTDAPVDSAARVVVEFTAVELKHEDEDDAERFELGDPVQIDLLTLQGSDFEALLSSENIRAGSYEWIRLHVNDNNCGELESGDNPAGSFIELGNGGLEPLNIPSGSTGGLRLTTDFDIDAGQDTRLIIDFDVRQSLVEATEPDCHFLKPVLRLVNEEDAGHISGTVNESLLTDSSCSDSDPQTGNAVYVFSGTETDDVDGNSPEPVTSGLVRLDNGNGLHEYEIGFLPAGGYTLAITCNADLDDPEADDGEVSFVSSISASVSASQTTTADFQ